MKILLLSNSGRPPYAWAQPILAEHLGGAKTIAFISAATMKDPVEYFEWVRAALEPAYGVTVLHADWRSNPLDAIARADVIFTGGGNTYALLSRLKQTKMLDAMRERVRGGAPYIGSSAGSNIAGPTILTTNDWNVVGLSEFTALGVVPFNINPHYLEADPLMAAGSETRDDRIAEYHVVNANPVIGIEEMAAVRLVDGVATVVGARRAKLFRPGALPAWFEAGARLPL